MPTQLIEVALRTAWKENAALRASLAAAVAAKEEAEREPRIRIDGCQHRKTRMIEWINEGACPVCLTAASGMNKDRAEKAEGSLCSVKEALKIEHGAGVADALSSSSSCRHAAEADALREELKVAKGLLKDVAEVEYKRGYDAARGGK